MIIKTKLYKTLTIKIGTNIRKMYPMKDHLDNVLGTKTSKGGVVID